MIRSPAQQLDRRLEDLNGVLRRLVSAIRGLDDFERFLGSLDRMFERVSELSGRSVRFELVPESGETAEEVFSEPELNAPVMTGPKIGGLVRVKPPGTGRPFGPGDLHLVGTLAEMTGILLDISGRIRRTGTVEHMLRLVYDQLPVGVVCFSATGEAVIANVRAQTMLGGMMWRSRDEALAFLTSHPSWGETTTAAARTCFSGASGAVMADVHEVVSEGAPATTVIVLVALDTQERNLRLTLEREIYRSRWLGQPLALLMLETSGDPGRLVTQVPAIRQSLRPGDCCEMLESGRVGIVLPGLERVRALQVARLVGRAIGGSSLRLACLPLRDGNERADVMVEEAVGALESATALLRPRLLVVDRFRAVSDMVEMVVGKTFAVEKAADVVEGLAWLQAKPVDGVVVEHEPDEGVSGIEFLQSARAWQPNVPGILTSTRLDLPVAASSIQDKIQFVKKPFSVVGLRRTLGALVPGVIPPR